MGIGKAKVRMETGQDGQDCRYVDGPGWTGLP